MSLHPWTRLCECPRSVLTSLHPGGLELALLHELAATGDGARRVNDAGALRHGVARVDQLLDLGLRHEIAVRRLERAGVLLLHRHEHGVDQLLRRRLLVRAVAEGREEELNLAELLRHGIDVALLDRGLEGEDHLAVLLQSASRLALGVRQGRHRTAQRHRTHGGGGQHLATGRRGRDEGILRRAEAQQADARRRNEGKSQGGARHLAGRR
mmetsp:Transcript_25947/g.77290  ORF Transcript_25947/g.77290 Transcript_25947/m.77290 type:complete len:211 (+) Transcript_25947:74-706(+)